MQILALQRGLFSGVSKALLDTWRVGAPDDEIVRCDLDEGYFENKVDKLKALPELIKASASMGMAEARRSYRQIALRSRSNLVRLEKAVHQACMKHTHDCTLMFQTLIPAPPTDKPNFIYTDHAILTNHYYPDGDVAIQRWRDWLPTEKNLIERAALIFTMSSHVSDSLVEFYNVPSERVRCVGAGFNARKSDAKPGTPPTSKNILFVGLDWERKGGPQMVEAFARVRESQPEARLVVVGCEPDIGEPGVEVLGVVPIERVGELMAEACCFCMPSLREPFGLVYLEAMNAGLPVVALNLGAPRDFVENGVTGFLVEPFDIGGLAVALEKLVANSELCAMMGRKARDRVSAEFNWETTQSRISKAIGEVLGA
jgi:glycosyltransferase involved in cell wall biosynthesis